MEFWTCDVCGFELETSEPKQADEERGVCSVCAESHKVDVNKQDGSWIVVAKIEVPMFDQIQTNEFGPYTSPLQAEECVTALATRTNVLSAKIKECK